jgi:hypothetical protein
MNQHGPGSCHVMNDTDDLPCFTTSSPAVDSSLAYLIDINISQRVEVIM